MGAQNVTFAPRDRLGTYELLLELASGGMATVGLALQHGAAGFERIVVVKRVHRKFLTDDSFLHMFRDEARLASSIRHPNVVPVIDVVEMPGELLLVMDYIESVSLGALLKSASSRGELLPPPVVGAILGDVLAGLHGAHEAVDLRRKKLDIVHRDVSPQNVIVGADGVTRVIDFGIAKAADRLASTRDGLLKGKFAYMSPEQADAMPLDRRSDVFSAAVVLYEALRGAPLFAGKSEMEIIRQVMTAEIPPLAPVVPGLPPAVDDVIFAALQRDPEKRFQSALAFHNALDTALPPARPREVAACVERLAGATLDEIGRRLQSVLGDHLERLSPRHHTGMHRAAPAELVPTVAASRSLDDAKIVSAASSLPGSRRDPAPAAPHGPTLRSSPEPALRSSIPSVPALAPSVASRRPLVVALIAASALVVGGGVAFAVSLAERSSGASAPPASNASNTQNASSPALPSQSNAPLPVPSNEADGGRAVAPAIDEPPPTAGARGTIPAPASSAKTKPHVKELAPNPY